MLHSHQASHRTCLQPKWPSLYSAGTIFAVDTRRSTGRRMEETVQQKGLIVLYTHFPHTGATLKTFTMLSCLLLAPFFFSSFPFIDVNYFPTCTIQLPEFNSSCEFYEFYEFFTISSHKKGADKILRLLACTVWCECKNSPAASL